ncbi:IPExxxVDY family protein [Tenacibaculum sp. UWU-22]|uniref:IPExxxVDY family protein n=1 Tax=Tenacibaculum sp. UWU-22 TaxID=3234187 RepID=UPI0034DAE544
MPVYTLEIDEFSNNDYTLIGVHTAIKDYKFTYLLNQQLNVKFSRASKDLDFENKNNNAFFALYEYQDKKLDTHWHLLSNVHKAVFKPTDSSLFEENTITTYLIPEKKKVDYFIKIEGNYSEQYIAESVEKINKIAQIITAYTIDINTLKSKDFLIF